MEKQTTNNTAYTCSVPFPSAEYTRPRRDIYASPPALGDPIPGGSHAARPGLCNTTQGPLEGTAPPPTLPAPLQPSLSRTASIRAVLIAQ